MTLRELLEEVEEAIEMYGEDMKVVAQDDNSIYGSDIDGFHLWAEEGVRAYWGDDYPAAVLKLGSQVGAIWDRDELDIEDNKGDDE